MASRLVTTYHFESFPGIRHSDVTVSINTIEGRYKEVEGFGLDSSEYQMAFFELQEQNLRTTDNFPLLRSSELFGSSWMQCGGNT